MSVSKYAFLFVGLALATYVTGWLLRDPISSAAFLALTIFTYWKAYGAAE
jgi:hypothetical protein